MVLDSSNEVKFHLATIYIHAHYTSVVSLKLTAVAMETKKLIRGDNDLYLLIFHISSTVPILNSIFTNRN